MTRIVTTVYYKGHEIGVHVDRFDDSFDFLDVLEKHKQRILASLVGLGMNLSAQLGTGKS